ncbi:hypothetical protein BTA30_14495 [Bacillus swezeyi]|nr:hypothetical protein BTA30_14495 [Bacillus swezeyi]
MIDNIITHLNRQVNGRINRKCLASRAASGFVLFQKKTKAASGLLHEDSRMQGFSVILFSMLIV